MSVDSEQREEEEGEEKEQDGVLLATTSTVLVLNNMDAVLFESWFAEDSEEDATPRTFNIGTAAARLLVHTQMQDWLSIQTDRMGPVSENGTVNVLGFTLNKITHLGVEDLGILDANEFRKVVLECSAVLNGLQHETPLPLTMELHEIQKDINVLSIWVGFWSEYTQQERSPTLDEGTGGEKGAEAESAATKARQGDELQGGLDTLPALLRGQRTDKRVIASTNFVFYCYHALRAAEMGLMDVKQRLHAAGIQPGPDADWGTELQGNPEVEQAMYEFVEGSERYTYFDFLFEVRQYRYHARMTRDHEYMSKLYGDLRYLNRELTDLSAVFNSIHVSYFSDKDTFDVFWSKHIDMCIVHLYARLTYSTPIPGVEYFPEFGVFVHRGRKQYSRRVSAFVDMTVFRNRLQDIRIDVEIAMSEDRLGDQGGGANEAWTKLFDSELIVVLRPLYEVSYCPVGE